MANDLEITIIGNLASDPELRFTPNGVAVANIVVAHTPRQFDKQANEWRDKDPLFLRGSIWREAAERATESFKKGDRVIVVGNLVSRNYETDAGEKRYVNELEIVDIGASTRYATVKITKATRPETGNGTPPPDGWENRSKSKAKSDPYSDVPPPAGPSDDEPPF